jgi:hypothetical protein
MTKSNLVGCSTGRSSGLAAPWNLAHVGSCLTIDRGEVGSIAHQTTGRSKLAQVKARGHFMVRGECRDPVSPTAEIGIAHDEDSNDLSF